VIEFEKPRPPTPIGREGALLPVTQVLRLAQPTGAGPIEQRKAALGEQLFDRSKSKLELTELGKTACR
jgi:DNA-binding transcriptional LysR family regulator